MLRLQQAKLCVTVTKLTPVQQRIVKCRKDDNTYTCGSALFASNNQYVDTLDVRESLRYNTSMEVAYYAGKACHFPGVCFYCGNEDHISTDDDIQSQKHKFSVVRPICAACKADAKEPAVRGEQNVGCKKKRK